MYLGALAAFRERLAGRPPEYEVNLGGPVLQALNSAEVNEEVYAQLRGFFEKEAVATVFGLPVPILDSLTGRFSTRLHPCFTFDCVGLEPRLSERVPFHDKVRRPVAFLEKVKDESGASLGPLPRMVQERSPQMGFNFLVEVGCYSRSSSELALLVAYLYSTLPVRTSLREPQKDGTHVGRYVLHRDSKNVTSPLGRGVGSLSHLEYQHVATYVVRSFLDNTDTWVLRNLVRRKQTTLEVDQ